MRLVRLDAPCFGPLQELSIELDPRCTVILGPNEAGKSSFLAAVETLLFGFEPARRDTHPLATWSGGGAADLALEGLWTFDGGEALRVERVLQDRGKLRTAKIDETFQGRRLGNRHLPEVESVPRNLFRAVYGLGAEDLRALGDDTREHVDELLLGENLLPGLRPAFRVRRELEAEAAKLWRKDRLGKPLAADLRREITAARKALGDARAREAELRSALEEKTELEERLASLRERLSVAEHERADLAFLGQLREVRLRRLRAGSVELSPLEEDALAAPAALRAELRALEGKLEQPRARLARKPLAVGGTTRRILEHAPRIEAVCETRASWEALVGSIAEARERGAKLAREARVELGRLSDRKTGKAELELVRTLPLEALRAAQASWAEAWESARDPRRERPRVVPGWVWPLALAAAVLSFLSWAGRLEPTFALVGIALFVLALAGAAYRRDEPPTPESLSPPPPAEALRPVSALGLDAALCATPSAFLRLCERLDGLAARAEQLDVQREKLRSMRRSAQRIETRAATLLQELGLESSGSATELFKRLQRGLDVARERAERARVDAAERAQCETLVQAHAPAMDRVAEHLGRVLATLRANTGEGQDEDHAHVAVTQRIEELAYLDRREGELRLDPRWTRLHQDERLDPEIEAEALFDLGAHDAKLRELAEEISRHDRRLGELDHLLADDPGSGVARAREYELDVSHRLTEVKRARDRLALLARLLDEAERQFRQENQPDVLRNASRYLAMVTDGRYVRLDYSEDDDEGLLVQPAGRDEPVRVGAPISRGARDQIYLCLRLGLLDHLDEARARLPLILDEALVHWDSSRRAPVYPLLREVSERRQVILLTCHEPLAREAEELLQTRRIELTGSAARAARRSRLPDGNRREAAPGEPL